MIKIQREKKERKASNNNNGKEEKEIRLEKETPCRFPKKCLVNQRTMQQRS